jgi:Predicted flavin-nucleotide-binding protein
MTAHPGQGDLEVIPAEECWALLRTQSIGRFAANRPGRSPIVVPVNYVVDADLSVVFRSGAGTKLDAVARGLVALQVDQIDPLHRTGWSVIVEGLGRWLYEEQDDAKVETWAPGSRPYVVRIQSTGITGRRIRLPQSDTDSRGYR